MTVVLSLASAAPRPGDGDAAIAAALARLTDGASLEDLRGELLARGGDRAFIGFLRHLERLDARGSLVRRVDGVAELVPATSFRPLRDRAPERVSLSRFASLVPDGGVFVLESPLSTARMRLRSADAIAPLSREGGATATDLPLDGARARSVVELLQLGRFLSTADASAALWEPHDLRFHMRSRAGRHDAPLGVTWRFASARPAPPAVKIAPAGERVALPVPDLVALERDDAPLQAVIERRTSERESAAAPSRADLGELLFRCARIRSRSSRTVERGGAAFPLDHAKRPFPAAGGMYELEPYLAVSRCDGLAAGLWWYDASAHELVRVAPPGDALDAILADAARITTRTAPPDVLLCLAARFGRLSWKYEGIAYAAILKDAGVLLQTLCLAASAMRLAACPVGFGNSEAFAALAGLDPLEESTVAELVIGGRGSR